MAVTLTKVGKTPSQTQFGLDTFTEHHKADATADVVLTDGSVPQKGDAHPDYPFMFLTDRHCAETGEKASSLDLVYMGALKDDGSGNPILPPSQHKYGTAIQTASSKTPITGAQATEPITLQFYAQTSELDFWSYNAPGVLNTAPDPLNDPIIISFGSYDIAYAPTIGNVDALVLQFFQIRMTDTITPNEIVSGKYWRNTELKTLFYGPPIFVVQVFGGTKAIAVWNAGSGYTVADSLTLTGPGGTATLAVTAIGVRDSITGFSISADTISSATFVIVDGVGGTGTGAQFVCVDLV